jgi:hypothetical protein
LKKDNKKEEKVSPKEDHSKKSAKKQEVEFDWSAWQDEPYASSSSDVVVSKIHLFLLVPLS